MFTWLDEPLRSVGEISDYLDFNEQKIVRKIKTTDLLLLTQLFNYKDVNDMIAENTINGKQAKEIFIKMLDGENGTPREIADKFGMKQMTDTGAIESIVEEVIAVNPAQVEQYKSGKVGLLGFFVGNVMKKTGGTANPAVVNEMLRNKLA